jgi:hypothetical protein
MAKEEREEEGERRGKTMKMAEKEEELNGGNVMKRDEKAKTQREQEKETKTEKKKNAEVTVLYFVAKSSAVKKLYVYVNGKLNLSTLNGSFSEE